LRLDYILVSDSIVNSSLVSTIVDGSAFYGADIVAGVEINDITAHISDHYPVHASWSDNKHPEIELF
jgi:hypothetical protein